VNGVRTRLAELETSAGAGSSRSGWILILLLTGGSLAMIAAIWWYYTQQRQAMGTAVSRELAAIAGVETNQIANWRRERIGDGRVFASSPAVTIARSILSSRVPAEGDRAALLALLERMSKEFLYSDAALVGLDGEVYLRLRLDTESGQLRQPVRRNLVRDAVHSGDVVLSDLSMDTRFGRPLMFLTIPIGDLGALLLDIDPETFLFPYLRSWPGPRRTAEILLVRREGNDIVYLNRTPQAGSSSFPRRPLTISLPPDAILNAGWTLTGEDYRGAQVLATVRRVPDSPWFLIVKIDTAEVYEPLRRLGWEMALVTALIGLANTAGAGLIWRQQQTRIHLEREALLYAVANDTPAYLWMTSATEENSFINRPLAELLGTERQKLGRNWVDYLHPDDADTSRSQFLECMESRSAYFDEFRIRRFDGQYRWVVNQAVPRFSEAGEFLGYAGALIDITDRKRREQDVQSLTARLIGAQEEERKRLARELHDDLNQQIAALSIATGNLKRQIPKEQVDLRAQSDRLHQKLVQVAETIRRMSHELHPAILEYSGLAPALRTHCEEFGAMTGIKVSLDIHGSLENVAPATALCIFRITQEALRNVGKHGGVKSASVEVERAGGQLRLVISDAGVGMDPAGVGTEAGLGLVSMKERARLVNGTVEIKSRPGEGTTITVKIPEWGGL
jgi:PAS domain S-box-containing protein